MTTKQKEFLQILETTLGNVTMSLNKTGIDREEFDEWMDEIDFLMEYRKVEDKSLDYVENKLIQEINKGNLSAIQFYLKTKGKNRGYV
jgi:hypothetical protein